MSPSRAAREIGVGIVGLGFMGRTHLVAYQAAARAGCANRVVALCDRLPERIRPTTARRGNLAAARGARIVPADARLYLDPRRLFAEEGVELVSLCTPTDTHVPLALAALRAGKHVLLEKPVALRARDVERLVAAARAARRLCMPAMCMRFWPGWSWLAETIRARTFGRVKSAVFRRLGSPPTWSRFYAETERSGGALFDLHVHDADFVRWCFGAPRSVSSAGSLDHVTTLYRYARGPEHVVAEGGWNHSPGFPFFMGYTVVFERATAEFALGRKPVLTLARGGRTRAVELLDQSGYDGEIRHVLAVLQRRERARATIAEAVGLVRMLEAERKSLVTGRPVLL